MDFYEVYCEGTNLKNAQKRQKCKKKDAKRNTKRDKKGGGVGAFHNNFKKWAFFGTFFQFSENWAKKLFKKLGEFWKQNLKI